MLRNKVNGQSTPLPAKRKRTKEEAKSIAELWANIKRLAEREEDEAPLPPPRTLPGQT